MLKGRRLRRLEAHRKDYGRATTAWTLCESAIDRGGGTTAFSTLTVCLLVAVNRLIALASQNDPLPSFALIASGRSAGLLKRALNVRVTGGPHNG
jgi:hypothetical protein